MMAKAGAIVEEVSIPMHSDGKSDTAQNIFREKVILACTLNQSHLSKSKIW